MLLFLVPCILESFYVIVKDYCRQYWHHRDISIFMGHTCLYIICGKYIWYSELVAWQLRNLPQQLYNGCPWSFWPMAFIIFTLYFLPMLLLISATSFTKLAMESRTKKKPLEYWSFFFFKKNPLFHTMLINICNYQLLWHVILARHHITTCNTVKDVI